MQSTPGRHWNLRAYKLKKAAVIHFSFISFFFALGYALTQLQILDTFRAEMQKFFSGPFTALPRTQFVFVTGYLRFAGMLVAIFSNHTMQIDYKRRSFLINKFHVGEIVDGRFKKGVIPDDVSVLDQVIRWLDALQ